MREYIQEGAAYEIKNYNRNLLRWKTKKFMKNVNLNVISLVLLLRKKNASQNVTYSR